MTPLVKGPGMGSMQRGGFGGFCAHRCAPRGCRSLRSRRHEGYTQHSRGGAGLCWAGDCTSGGMMPTKVLFQNPAFMVLHVLGPHPHRGTFLLLAAFGRGTRGHNPPKMHGDGCQHEPGFAPKHDPGCGRSFHSKHDHGESRG